MYDRALAGMSSLLGREVQPIDRTQQLEKQLDTLQTRSTPNILTTVPRLAPIATPPPPPGTPTTAATPFSYTDWMSKQNAKGT
jgi:hypothetical protein